MDDCGGFGRKLGLEELFFLKEDRKLIEKLRQMKEMQATIETLRDVSGIHDESILRKLIELDIRPETVSSLSLVPLIEVAWADGAIDEKEKAAVLAAASDTGIRPGSTEYELLDNWMGHRPGPEMIEAWIHYIRGLCRKLSEDERRLLKADLIGQAVGVATASGGFLGMGNKVSAQEAAMLHRLEGAFAPPPSA